MRSLEAILDRRNTVTVSGDATVQEAARIMASHSIGALPVVRDNRLVGIFTERDVLMRVVAAGRDAAALPVGDVMTTELVMADVTESYQACLERMQQARVRHLIVQTRDGRTGILSLRDLLAVDLQEKGEQIAFLNAYVS